MGSKPKVAVTRKLPEAAEARLRRDCEPLFNSDDHMYCTGEPSIHPGYAGLDKPFLLSHIGSAMWETGDAVGFRALDNLDAVFAGREPGDRVAWRSRGAVHGGAASLNCWYIAYKNPSKAPAQTDRRG